MGKDVPGKALGGLPDLVSHAVAVVGVHAGLANNGHAPRLAIDSHAAKARLVDRVVDAVKGDVTSLPIVITKQFFFFLKE